jgi:hypothetical protein
MFLAPRNSSSSFFRLCLLRPLTALSSSLSAASEPLSLLFRRLLFHITIIWLISNDDTVRWVNLELGITIHLNLSTF